MDPFTTGLAVTSATLSAILFIILYVKRGDRNSANIAIVPGSIKDSNKQATNAIAKSANSNQSTIKLAGETSNKSSNGTVKQVHFSDTIQVKMTGDGPKFSKHNGHFFTSNKSVNNSKQGKGSKKSKHNNNNKTNGNNNINENNNEIETLNKNPPATTQTDFANADQELHDIEPACDELDSIVSVEVFNSSKTGGSNSKSKSYANDFVKKAPRRRQNSDQVSYSSEKLFSMIAESNLSQDELQLAIDTLLNKLDSAEAEWRQPKSDPIQRLKNQLRDTETNLATEVQNHKQTRARLYELKVELQNERSAKNQVNEEVTKLKDDLATVNVTLDKVQRDLAQQKSIKDQVECESSKLIGKLEQENVHLQSMLASKSNVHDDELIKMQNELEGQQNKLNCYELANQNLSSKIQELESNLHDAEMKLDQLLNKKRQDDYEACAKITELESDRQALDKSLKKHIQQLKELSETNNLLENSNKDLQIMNGRQDELLMKLQNERHVNEASMKRTLYEMEQELRELQAKLSSKSSVHDERLLEEINHFERELNDADQREQKLAANMSRLRQGLSELFPDLPLSNAINAEDWVHQYLIALKQLAQTVDELRHSIQAESPGSSGRPSSRATNHSSDHEKKVKETKLVELDEEIEKLKHTNLRSNDDPEKDFESVKQDYERQIRDLASERDKLKTQIKIGIDSFRVEQKRAQELEEKLAKHLPLTQSSNISGG